MTNKTKGFIYGAIAAASYGMNPLFALPLYAAGMSVDTVLFYRYFFATIVLGILMKMQHQSFALELESAIQQYQRAETKLGGAVTTISKKVDTINQHIDKVLENAPTQLKVSVNVNDADWQKIQELFAKERQWMTAQMQTHIREVNSMLADEREKVRERYKEYDGCYLGHYAQWFFWFFFTIGIFVVAGGVLSLIHI